MAALVDETMTSQDEDVEKCGCDGRVDGAGFLHGIRQVSFKRDLGLNCCLLLTEGESVGVGVKGVN